MLQPGATWRPPPSPGRKRRPRRGIIRTYGSGSTPSGSSRFAVGRRTFTAGPHGEAECDGATWSRVARTTQRDLPAAIAGDVAPGHDSGGVPLVLTEEELCPNNPIMSQEP